MFIFNPLQINDLITLEQWFRMPGVNKWYGREERWPYEKVKAKYLPRIEGKENCPGFIVEFEGKEIGFIQYYFMTSSFPDEVTSFEHNLFKDYKPDEIAGVDLFMIDTMQGKGIGTKFLEEFITDIIPAEAKLIVIDPKVNNKRAIKAYEKVGFKPFEVINNTQLLIMTRN